MSGTAATTIGEPIGQSSWRTLAITSLVGFMVSLELTIIALALPEIRDAFPDTSESALSFVITAYSIGVASLLLIAGWLADRVGRKRIFLTGLIVFTVASLIAGTAPSAGVLIAARILQAVGGAMQFPSGLALLLPAFPVERRQMAIGIWGAMGGLAAAVGPSLGALLVDAFGWRAVFLINVPVAIAATVLGALWLTESTGDVPARVDLVSVPLAAIGVGTFVLGIVQGSDWGWGSAATVGSFAVGTALLTVFVLRSLHHPTPLFDLGLFRAPSYAIGNIGTVFFTTAFFGWLVLLPSFIQGTWGWSVLQTGFAIAPGPMVATLVAPPAGRLADRIGTAPILTVGGLAGVAGMVTQLLSTGTSPDYVTGLLLPGLLVGLAGGCSFAMLVGATMRDVPPARFGMGGAGRTTVFQLSIAVGVAIAVAVVGSPSGPDEALDAIRTTWAISGLLFAGQVVTFAVVFPRLAGRRAH